MDAGGTFRLPASWTGQREATSDGNPTLAAGTPVWRLDQVWPADPSKPANFRPLVWKAGWWVAAEHGFGGQPKAELKDNAIRLEFRAPHGEHPGEKLAGLVFVAPTAGTYTLSGTADLKLWDGDNRVALSILHKTTDAVTTVQRIPLKRNAAVPLENLSVELAAGDELVLLPRIDGMFTGGDVSLRSLTISAGGSPSWRLPAAWSGTEVGATAGNPALAGGVPVWRLDRLFPSDPTLPGNYAPLVWAGDRWAAADHTQAGHPSVGVADGTATFSTLGPWGGGQESQKTAALVFIAPESGAYRIRGTARTKPWDGKAAIYRLVFLKKDTQRAAEVTVLELPRNGAPVPFDVSVELTAGHELLLMPLMPDWHNATTTTVERLQIVREQ